MTTWNEHETDKCWEEVKSILRSELVVGVPTTYVSENHGYVQVYRGTKFPSSGSDAESSETGCVRMAHSDTKIMPQIRPTWYGGEMTGKRNSCRGMRLSRQGSEWKSNSKHVEHMVRLWRLKLESKETPTPVTKASEKHRQSTCEKQCQKSERNACWRGNVETRAWHRLGTCRKHCQSCMERVARAGGTARTRSTRGWTALFQRTWMRAAPLGDVQMAASERVR